MCKRVDIQEISTIFMGRFPHKRRLAIVRRVFCLSLAKPLGTSYCCQSVDGCAGKRLWKNTTASRATSWSTLLYKRFGTCGKVPLAASAETWKSALRSSPSGRMPAPCIMPLKPSAPTVFNATPCSASENCFLDVAFIHNRLPFRFYFLMQRLKYYSHFKIFTSYGLSVI
jgi:hypothetical protein